MVSASSFLTNVFKSVCPFVLFPWCYGGLERSVRLSGASKGDSAFTAGGTRIRNPADARPIACGGDQNPYRRRSDVVPGMTNLELAQQYGRALSNAVEVAFSANPRPLGGPIRADYEEVAMEYAKPGKAVHRYPVQVIKLSRDLTLNALRSEVVVDYSLRFKRELAGAGPVWVAGYSNDYNGYIPRLPVLKEGGYEAAAG